MLCVPRAAVARSSPWRAREQPESRDRRKILSFESERKSSTFLNHTCIAYTNAFKFSHLKRKEREGERRHGGELATVARGTLSMSCLLLARAAHVASTALILPKDSPLCEDHV